MLERFEKVEKSLHEKENLTRLAKEESRAITSEIACKEQDLRKCQEALEAKDKMMQAVTQRL